MKKTYAKPEIEITAFTTEDIITASTVSSGMKDGGSVNADSASGINIDLSNQDGWKS